MLLTEGGRETGAFQAEKWDTDQIAWTVARDYDDARLIRPGTEPNYRHFYKYNCLPYEVYRAEDCNGMTAAGWTAAIATGSFLGTTGTIFSTTVGRIGLGTGTVAGYSDTALNAIGALTIANWILCGVAPVWTAPTGTVTPGTLVFTATFGTTQANGVPITEFAIDHGTANTLSTAAVSGMINHGSAAAGTKTSAQTWNVTATLTFT